MLILSHNKKNLNPVLYKAFAMCMEKATNYLNIYGGINTVSATYCVLFIFLWSQLLQKLVLKVILCVIKYTVNILKVKIIMKRIHYCDLSSSIAFTHMLG